jgi:lincosamide nucleotidyltransferase A/C/D/E
MVTDVGDDARWNVSAADVGTVLGIAHRAGFNRVWIAGGWGVDALVGHQTRIHSDFRGLADREVDPVRLWWS